MADDMRTLGYICPKCGAQVMGARSVFALEASDAESNTFLYIIFQAFIIFKFTIGNYNSVSD